MLPTTKLNFYILTTGSNCKFNVVYFIVFQCFYRVLSIINLIIFKMAHTLSFFKQVHCQLVNSFEKWFFTFEKTRFFCGIKHLTSNLVQT